jgi:Tol biopolymer transport system component
MRPLRPLRPILLSIGLAATLAGLALGPVSATYPGGTNGRIAIGVRAADGTANIFTIRPNGTGMRQLTTGSGFHLCPSYSADGRQIAYCSNASGTFEIWTMRQDGTRQRQLTHLGGWATFPDFSPNGSKIAFSGNEGSDPNGEIYVVNARTGGGLRALTSCAAFGPGCHNDTPAWSPDGTKIVFSHTDDMTVDEDNINEQIWVMDADGGHQHPLTTGPAPKDQVPDWSPDGSRIAYTAGFYGSEGTWVMNADGSHQHQLTGCGATDPVPCAQGDDWATAWSPDGTRIAFLRDLTALGTNDRPVFVMNADGSGQHRITSDPLLPGVPAWQPLDVRGDD